jgi:hypothetical protein
VQNDQPALAALLTYCSTTKSYLTPAQAASLLALQPG